MSASAEPFVTNGKRAQQHEHHTRLQGSFHGWDVLWLRGQSLRNLKKCNCNCVAVDTMTSPTADSWTILIMINSRISPKWVMSCHYSNKTHLYFTRGHLYYSETQKSLSTSLFSHFGQNKVQQTWICLLKVNQNRLGLVHEKEIKESLRSRITAGSLFDTLKFHLCLSMWCVKLFVLWELHRLISSGRI